MAFVRGRSETGFIPCCRGERTPCHAIIVVSSSDGHHTRSQDDSAWRAIQEEVLDSEYDLVTFVSMHPWPACLLWGADSAKSVPGLRVPNAV